MGHDLPGRHPVARSNQVLAAQLRLVHAERDGQAIDQSLVGDGHLGRPEAAHGSAGVLVGEDADDIDRDVRDAIGARGVAGGLAHDGDPGRGVGPLVDPDGDFRGRESPVAPGAEPVVDPDRVTLVARDHRLGARVAQADRLARVPQGREPQVDLDRDVLAPSERASGRGLQDAYALQRQAERERDQAALLVDPLAGHFDGQDRTVVTRAAGLEVEERVVDDLGLERVLHHDVALGERAGRVPFPDALLGQDVSLVVDARSVGAERLVDIEDRRKRPVLDADLAQRLDRGLFAARHHQGDGVSQVAHLAAAKHLLVAADQAVQVRPWNVQMCKDREDAGQPLGFAGIDRKDLGVRVRRAQDLGVEARLREEVLTVPGSAGCLVRGVQARRVGADHGRPHGRRPSARADSSRARSIVL